MTDRIPLLLDTDIGSDIDDALPPVADECRRRFARVGGPLEIVAQVAEVWFRGRPEITFHDPLAGAVVFIPELCELQGGEVVVETASGASAGLTAFHPRADERPHRVAVDVAPSRFFDHYFEVLESAPA